MMVTETAAVRDVLNVAPVTAGLLVIKVAKPAFAFSVLEHASYPTID
jgi:hypothetical protein